LVKIAWSAMTIQPPTNGTALHQAPISVSCVRVWEPEPPEGVEALEWILVTSIAVSSADDAWQCVTWYKWRWFIEDFHKVLKTGCLLEDRWGPPVEAMCNLLGILTPAALRLLWLREVAQTAPDTPETFVISKEVIQVVLHLDKRPKATLTALDLWHTIARFGGYLTPFKRSPSRMADFMEGLDTRSDGLGRCSSRTPFFSLMICVSVSEFNTGLKTSHH
jgi:hypothetical protein